MKKPSPAASIKYSGQCSTNVFSITLQSLCRSESSSGKDLFPPATLRPARCGNASAVWLVVEDSENLQRICEARPSFSNDVQQGVEAAEFVRLLQPVRGVVRPARAVHDEFVAVAAR